MRTRGIWPLALSMAAGLGCSPVQPRPAGAPPEAPGVRGGLTSAELDRQIDQLWRAAAVTPAPPAGDGEFLRRVTLDLAGRIPTLDEARAFLADGAPGKRERAVDRLLGSPAFAEHFADLYAGLLFGDEGQGAKIERQFDPRAFLVRAFDQSWGWDRITWELLTASGDLRDNGALGFLVARAKGGGGAEAVTGAAARIFLGLQIQCAQCHDHPYDTRWKQEDFYGLVAFFARTKARNEKLDAAAMAAAKDAGGGGGEGEAQGEPQMQSPMATAMQGKAGRGKPRTFVVLDVRRGEARMRRPRSEAEERVAPRFLGRPVDDRRGESRRQAFARAVLGSDLFAKAMVARTWTQLFGRGIVDPWDDLGAERDPRHPTLLVRLAEDFAAHRYGVKHLVRRLVLSRAYGRSSAPSGGDRDEAGLRAFARAGVRPLTPEQLFRSLVTGTGADEMARRRDDRDKIARRLEQAFREYSFVFADDEMAEADRFNGSMPQALLLLNGELTNAGTRAEPGGLLARVLGDSRDPARRVEDLFLAAYARRPAPDERAALVAYLREQGGGRAAYEDLLFALLTSTEAITNH